MLINRIKRLLRQGEKWPVTVSKRTRLVDTSQQRREDGAEPLKAARGHEARRPGAYPRGAGQGRQDHDNKRNNTINIMNRYFKF